MKKTLILLAVTCAACTAIVATKKKKPHYLTRTDKI